MQLFVCQWRAPHKREFTMKDEKWTEHRDREILKVYKHTHKRNGIEENKVKKCWKKG